MKKKSRKIKITEQFKSDVCEAIQVLQIFVFLILAFYVARFVGYFISFGTLAGVESIVNIANYSINVVTYTVLGLSVISVMIVMVMLLVKVIKYFNRHI